MKKRTIIDIFLIFILLILLIFLGTRDYSKDNQKDDSNKFDSEYTMVDKDNNFKYITDEETYKILESGSGIIFMGFSENEWTNYYAKIINELAKEKNIEEMYYYDFKMDRAKKTVNYTKIIDKLMPMLRKDDEGNVKLMAPTLVIVKNGDIILFDDETSFPNANITPEEYWSDEALNYKKEHLSDFFDSFVGGNNYGGEN